MGFYVAGRKKLEFSGPSTILWRGPRNGVNNPSCLQDEDFIQSASSTGYRETASK